MRAGKLNRLVTIQRPGPGRDEVGQPIDEWLNVATVWANIVHKSGIETIRADAPVSSVRASIRIRYRTDIDATMRVFHGATVYQVLAVMPDAAGREFADLVCETGARQP
jgi:SPP1 family predicted phage head-tail adaptor